MREKELQQVRLFLGLTIFLSFFVFWGPLAILKVPTANLADGSSGPFWALLLFIIGGFVPSILGIILTACFNGRTGVRQLFRESMNIRVERKWIALIIFVSLCYGLSWIMIHRLLGGTFNYLQFFLQLPLALPLIVLGPLSEEYGWRGFALRRLLNHYSATSASLLVGVCWALWHLPLFYIVGSSQFEFSIPFLPFGIMVIGSSFAYTYVYLKTQCNLFSAILFHWVFTYVATVVYGNIERTELYNWLELIPAVIIGLVFFLILKKSKLPIPYAGKDSKL